MDTTICLTLCFIPCMLFTSINVSFIFYMYTKGVLIIVLSRLVWSRFGLIVPFSNDILCGWLKFQTQSYQEAAVRRLWKSWVKNNFHTCIGVTLAITCLLHPEMTESLIHMIRDKFLALWNNYFFGEVGVEVPQKVDALVNPLKDQMSPKIEEPLISKPTNYAAWGDWGWMLFVTGGVVALTIFTR